MFSSFSKNLTKRRKQERPRDVLPEPPGSPASFYSPGPTTLVRPSEPLPRGEFELVQGIGIVQVSPTSAGEKAFPHTTRFPWSPERGGSVSGSNRTASAPGRERAASGAGRDRSGSNAVREPTAGRDVVLSPSAADRRESSHPTKTQIKLDLDFAQEPLFVEGFPSTIFGAGSRPSSSKTALAPLKIPTPAPSPPPPAHIAAPPPSSPPIPLASSPTSSHTGSYTESSSSYYSDSFSYIYSPSLPSAFPRNGPGGGRARSTSPRLTRQDSATLPLDADPFGVFSLPYSPSIRRKSSDAALKGKVSDAALRRKSSASGDKRRSSSRHSRRGRRKSVAGSIGGNSALTPLEPMPPDAVERVSGISGLGAAATPSSSKAASPHTGTAKSPAPSRSNDGTLQRETSRSRSRSRTRKRRPPEAELPTSPVLSPTASIMSMPRESPRESVSNMNGRGANGFSPGSEANGFFPRGAAPPRSAGLDANSVSPRGMPNGFLPMNAGATGFGQFSPSHRLRSAEGDFPMSPTISMSDRDSLALGESAGQGMGESFSPRMSGVFPSSGAGGSQHRRQKERVSRIEEAREDLSPPHTSPPQGAGMGTGRKFSTETHHAYGEYFPKANEDENDEEGYDGQEGEGDEGVLDMGDLLSQYVDVDVGEYGGYDISPYVQNVSPGSGEGRGGHAEGSVVREGGRGGKLPHSAGLGSNDAASGVSGSGLKYLEDSPGFSSLQNDRDREEEGRRDASLSPTAKSPPIRDASLSPTSKSSFIRDASLSLKGDSSLSPNRPPPPQHAQTRVLPPRTVSRPPLPKTSTPLPSRPLPPSPSMSPPVLPDQDVRDQGRDQSREGRDQREIRPLPVPGRDSPSLKGGAGGGRESPSVPPPRGGNVNMNGHLPNMSSPFPPAPPFAQAQGRSSPRPTRPTAPLPPTPSPSAPVQPQSVTHELSRGDTPAPASNTSSPRPAPSHSPVSAPAPSPFHPNPSVPSSSPAFLRSPGPGGPGTPPSRPSVSPGPGTPISRPSPAAGGAILSPGFVPSTPGSRPTPGTPLSRPSHSPSPGSGASPGLGSGPGTSSPPSSGSGNGMLSPPAAFPPTPAFSPPPGTPGSRPSPSPGPGSDMLSPPPAFSPLPAHSPTPSHGSRTPLTSSSPFFRAAGAGLGAGVGVGVGSRGRSPSGSGAGLGMGSGGSTPTPGTSASAITTGTSDNSTVTGTPARAPHPGTSTGSDAERNGQGGRDQHAVPRAPQVQVHTQSPPPVPPYPSAKFTAGQQRQPSTSHSHPAASQSQSQPQAASQLQSQPQLPAPDADSESMRSGTSSTKSRQQQPRADSRTGTHLSAAGWEPQRNHSAGDVSDASSSSHHGAGVRRISAVSPVPPRRASARLPIGVSVKPTPAMDRIHQQSRQRSGSESALASPVRGGRNPHTSQFPETPHEFSPLTPSFIQNNNGTALSRAPSNAGYDVAVPPRSNMPKPPLIDPAPTRRPGRPPLPIGPRKPSIRVAPSSLSRSTTAPPTSPRFEADPVRWRGLTMDAAKWTFTSGQLQDIVGRAIRQSAEASSIRLLTLDVLDKEFPPEIARLETLREELKTQYRQAVRKRRAVQREGGPGLVQELVELGGVCDAISEELVRVMDELQQISRLRDVHSASALAMALRKLNSSFVKQSADVNELRAHRAQLEAERDEAWATAERVERDLLELQAKMDMAMASTPATPSASNRSSRVSAARKTSVRASKASLRFSRGAVRSSHSSTSSNRLSSVVAPPVPPMPRLMTYSQTLSLNTDLPSASLGTPYSMGMSSGLGHSPTSETRELVQVQNELYSMLGLTRADLRRTRSGRQPQHRRPVSEVMSPSSMPASPFPTTSDILTRPSSDVASPQVLARRRNASFSHPRPDAIFFEFDEESRM